MVQAHLTGFILIQFNSALNQIVLRPRNLSEIYIIDHSTTSAEAATNFDKVYGKGGDILYRWGNPQSYNQGTETERKLYGQHYPCLIETSLVDENKLILFNNGNGRDPLFSEVHILNPEADSPGVYSYITGTAYGPSETDYIYEDPITPTDFYSRILGSAQRLPNRNTLICEGINGRIFEITPAEELVWEYLSPVKSDTRAITTQGDAVSSFVNILFKGIKYSTDYSVFTGRDLTPLNPIELNLDLTPCNNLSVSDFDQLTFNLYPNPTKGKLQIHTVITIKKVEIYNMLGSNVGSSTSDIVYLSKHLSGICFLKIYSS